MQFFSTFSGISKGNQEIKRVHPVKKVAKQLGHSRNTVAKAA